MFVKSSYTVNMKLKRAVQPLRMCPVLLISVVVGLRKLAEEEEMVQSLPAVTPPKTRSGVDHLPVDHLLPHLQTVNHFLTLPSVSARHRSGCPSQEERRGAVHQRFRSKR